MCILWDKVNGYNIGSFMTEILVWKKWKTGVRERRLFKIPVVENVNEKYHYE